MSGGKSLFTIGHSSSTAAIFLETLLRFQIETLVDVRSRPQSFRFPHFNQKDLEQLLHQADVRYLFLGEELGGRPDDRDAYREDGLVNYRARRKSFAFQAGVDRVLRELERGPLALMCAEEDPIMCHRFLMICPELVEAGLEPRHLRKGGIVETQQEAEDRLLKVHHMADLASSSLFKLDRAAALEEAYTAQAEKCAFRSIRSLVDSLFPGPGEEWGTY